MVIQLSWPWIEGSFVTVVVVAAADGGWLHGCQRRREDVYEALECVHDKAQVQHLGVACMLMALWWPILPSPSESLPTNKYPEPVQILLVNTKQPSSRKISSRTYSPTWSIFVTLIWFRLTSWWRSWPQWVIRDLRPRSWINSGCYTCSLC